MTTYGHTEFSEERGTPYLHHEDGRSTSFRNTADDYVKRRYGLEGENLIAITNQKSRRLEIASKDTEHPELNVEQTKYKCV